jgi:hypothetical protein
MVSFRGIVPRRLRSPVFALYLISSGMPDAGHLCVAWTALADVKLRCSVVNALPWLAVSDVGG